MAGTINNGFEGRDDAKRRHSAEKGIVNRASTADQPNQSQAKPSTGPKTPELTSGDDSYDENIFMRAIYGILGWESPTNSKQQITKNEDNSTQRDKGTLRKSDGSKQLTQQNPRSEPTRYGRRPKSCSEIELKASQTRTPISPLARECPEHSANQHQRATNTSDDESYDENTFLGAIYGILGLESHKDKNTKQQPGKGTKPGRDNSPGPRSPDRRKHPTGKAPSGQGIPLRNINYPATPPTPGKVRSSPKQQGQCRGSVGTDGSPGQVTSRRSPQVPVGLGGIRAKSCSELELESSKASTRAVSPLSRKSPETYGTRPENMSGTKGQMSGTEGYISGNMGPMPERTRRPRFKEDVPIDGRTSLEGRGSMEGYRSPEEEDITSDSTTGSLNYDSSTTVRLGDKTASRFKGLLPRAMTTGHISEREMEQARNAMEGLSYDGERPELFNGHANGKLSTNSIGKAVVEEKGGSHLEEGTITAIKLPTARKGFIGEIGFRFGGAERSEDNPDNWEPMPILVESVARGSIADKAGLEVGDEIIKINGVSVKNAARSLAVTLIRDSQKKILILVRKGKGGKRTHHQVFSTDQLEEFTDAFNLYDRSNKRRIHVNDVPQACRILGFNETALHFDNAINSARVRTGERDSNKISLETFIEIVKELRKFQDINQDGRFAYAVFDPEDKGRFNIRLLRDALLASNKKISPLEMVEIFRMADPDFDERVKRKEFISLLHPYIEMY